MPFRRYGALIQRCSTAGNIDWVRADLPYFKNGSTVPFEYASLHRLSFIALAPKIVLFLVLVLDAFERVTGD
jgi:hypothetical protein